MSLSGMMNEMFKHSGPGQGGVDGLKQPQGHDAEKGGETILPCCVSRTLCLLPLLLDLLQASTFFPTRGTLLIHNPGHCSEEGPGPGVSWSYRESVGSRWQLYLTGSFILESLKHYRATHWGYSMTKMGKFPLCLRLISRTGSRGLSSTYSPSGVQVS